MLDAIATIGAATTVEIEARLVPPVQRSVIARRCTDLHRAGMIRPVGTRRLASRLYTVWEVA